MASKISNHNLDITISELKPEDIYDGIICQSFGNISCVYKLVFNEEWYYLVIAKLDKVSNTFIKVEDVYKHPFTGFNSWCITKNSVLFDKLSIRDYKLSKLLD